MRKKKIVARKPGKKRKKKLIPIISNIRHPDTGELVHPSFFPENPAMPSEQEKFNKNFDKRMKEDPTFRKEREEAVAEALKKPKK